jgi:HSP20 family protein
MFGAHGKTPRGLVRTSHYPMLSLFDEMNRLFEDTLPLTQNNRSATSFRPTIDLCEKEREYILTGEFPGLEAKDIEIELRDNILTLSGEKKACCDDKEKDHLHVERAFGSFKRSIQLPEEVDEDNTTAEMKNGVLTVRIPKSAKVVRGARKVSVTSA